MVEGQTTGAPVDGSAISTYVVFPCPVSAKVSARMERGMRQDITADRQAEVEEEVSHNNPLAVVGVGTVHGSDSPLEEDIGTRGGMHGHHCACWIASYWSNALREEVEGRGESRDAEADGREEQTPEPEPELEPEPGLELAW